MIPAARVADQPRVESEHLRLRDDLAPPARRKRPHQMRDVRDLINLQPVRDRGPADLAFGGQLRHVQHPAALAHQQFQHAQKSGALLQPEKLLHVAREVGIQPLGVEFGIVFLREQGGRQPPRNKRSRKSVTPKAGNSSCNTGTSSTTRLRPVRLSRNFCVAASVEEPVARIFNLGKPSAPIFNSRLGSGS
jgi:hypothetical protein